MVQTKDITITRVFDAPRAKVWDAWTKPEHIAKWWGPKDFTGFATKNELQVGGMYVYCMRGAKGTDFDKDMWSAGIYKEVIPMEKIVASDYFSDAEGNKITPKDYGMPGEWPVDEMEVTVTFEDAGEGKTKVTVLHKGHPADFAHMAEMGWSQSLDKFAAIL